MTRWSAISPIPPPGHLRTLSWATLANTLGSGLWLAGSALYLTRGVGLSAPAVGLALTLAAVVGLAAGVPLGGLADRYDPRRLRAILQLLQTGVAAAYLLVDSFSSLIVVAVVDALPASGNLAVRAALVAAIAGPRGRVAAFATLRAVANLGIGAGAALAGLALTVDTPLAYRLLVIGNASTYAISAALLMRLPAVRPARAASTPRRGLLGPALRDGPFLAVGSVSAVLSLHEVILALIIPLWVVSHTAAPGRPGRDRRVPGRRPAARRCGRRRRAGPADTADPGRRDRRVGGHRRALRGRRPAQPAPDPLGACPAGQPRIRRTCRTRGIRLRMR